MAASKQRAAMKRQSLALWFPYLACERVQALSQGPPETEPLVLVEKIKGALRLVAVDAGAAQLGLQAGLALADAQAQIPGLRSEMHDPDGDAQFLKHIAARLVRFTPMVALNKPDGLVLDMTGCMHLFASDAALVKQVRAVACLTMRHAWGGNAAAARALGRYGKGGGDIRQLPVTALELDAAASRALRRAGLSSIGDLAARPMAAIAARFGEAAVTRLRQILGEVDAPIAPRRAAPRLRFKRRFAEPIARTDDALEVIEELLGEAALKLEERKAGGRRFAATLCRSDGATRVLTIETSLPLRDPVAIMRLFRERIDTLSDPLDPGFGFDAVRLAILRSDPLAEFQLDSEDARQPAQDSLNALIDRLSVRLGAENVLRLAPQDTHIPEIAQRAFPAMQWAKPPAWPKLNPEVPPRPLFLFDPPQPIEAIAEVPDGPPHRFRWRRTMHDVRLSEGPERIAAEWWRRRSGHEAGKGGLTRDYYRIEDTDGRRYWIFRHGLYDEAQAPRWYMHGLFA